VGPEEPARAEALAVAQRALARRDLSGRELRDRLAQAGLEPAIVEEALETLRRGGLVDDERFAVERARVLAERGKGDLAVRFDLERHSIPAELVESTLAALEPERERAERVVASRGGGPKTARLLASRGFGEEIVSLVAGAGVAQEP
jgi:SOS response regulatory protein OraA/RecX